MKLPVIAIFDIGKTNKKLLLFDQQYKLLHEESTQITETTDEDGYACEDIDALSKWILDRYNKILTDERFRVKAINFSAYGASFVHVDADGKPITPLYNYLKPFPETLKKSFYNKYGGESLIAKQTASPVLGNLNSGMQLYRLKYEKPELYNAIKYSLHLPQYISYLITGLKCTDITSVGCHTNLWNFQKNGYHHWVEKEGLVEKFPALKSHDETVTITQKGEPIFSGIGLHDSSAALIPYLASFKEPFVLLSTGTWCISIHPFNHTLLTDYELHQDCLSYLTYEGKPVKASRLFAGYEHEQQVKRLAQHFDKPVEYYKTVTYEPSRIRKAGKKAKNAILGGETAMVKSSSFSKKPLDEFATYEEAYHHLIQALILQQVQSTKIVLSGSPVKTIFVDGGFGKNPIYMNLLAQAFPGIKVYAATVAQASSLGAALAIHKSWNKKAIPSDIIDLQLYDPQNEMAV